MDRLDLIAAKVHNHQRISIDDAAILYQTTDLFELGKIAHAAVAPQKDQTVWFNDHRYVRISVEAEKLPADLSQRESFFVDEILSRCAAVVTDKTSEFRFGSLHPARIPFALLRKILTTIREQYPHISVRALSARHILQYAALESCSIETILSQLKECGVVCLDGRGAGLFHHKNEKSFGLSLTIQADSWLKVHKAAHIVGIRSDATMIYGYGESVFERLHHMACLRQLQDETEGFVSFIPLPPPYQISMPSPQTVPVSFDHLRTLAVARIFLDNFSHISSVWGRVGLDTAQVAMHFGADDMEGALCEDQNLRLAQYRPFRALNRSEIRQVIRKGERQPRERGPLFVPLSELNDRDRPSERVRSDDLLFYKVEQGQSLTFQEALSLARTTDLLCLGQLASHLLNRQDGSQTVTYLSPWKEITPRDYAFLAIESRFPFADLVNYGSDDGQINFILDLARQPEIKGSHPFLATEQGFLQVVTTIKNKYPQNPLIVRGIKGLWGMTYPSHLNLEKLLLRLQAAGVVTVESSSWESEDDLTHSEIIETHQAIHQVGMGSVAKVELAAPYHGVGEPFWDMMIQRLQALEALQKQTGGILGIHVTPAPGAFISPVEYLRAISLARILCPHIPAVIAELHRWPSLSTSRRANADKIPLEMIQSAEIAFQFGANDLGSSRIPPHELHQVFQDLKTSGKSLVPRDSRFRRQYDRQVSHVPTAFPDELTFPEC